MVNTIRKAIRYGEQPVAVQMWQDGEGWSVTMKSARGRYFTECALCDEEAYELASECVESGGVLTDAPEVAA